MTKQNCLQSPQSSVYINMKIIAIGLLICVRGVWASLGMHSNHAAERGAYGVSSSHGPVECLSNDCTRLINSEPVTTFIYRNK